MQAPKNILKHFKTRNIAIGKERRRNAVKVTLENQPHFPKTVEYEDIDQAIADWVSNDIELVYEGRKFPTYKLFSNQRISEYGQNWKEVDEKGNIDVNFKTVTREPNPQHGENQGGNYNIPGNRRYVVFQTKILEENGDEVTQLYTMKQPFAVNLTYSISVVTASYSMLNKMNSIILDTFKALEKYIFPNGFAMPMLLNSISDESDYTIDDRKYYAQTYQVKVMGFIVKPEDYEVMKVPSRTKNTFVAGENSSKKASKKSFNLDTLNYEDFDLVTYKSGTKCEPEYAIENEDKPVDFEDVYNPVSGRTEIEVMEYNGKQACYADTEYEMYVNKKSIYNISVNPCESSCTFTIEENVLLETIELINSTLNILYINNVEINIEDSDVIFNEGDEIKITYTVKDPVRPASIKLICYDPNSIIENGEDISQYDSEYMVD